MTPRARADLFLALPEAARNTIVREAFEAKLGAFPGGVAGYGISVIAYALRGFGLIEYEDAYRAECVRLMATERDGERVETTPEADGENRERLRAVLIAVDNRSREDGGVDSGIIFRAFVDDSGGWTFTDDPHLVLAAACLALAGGDVTDEQVAAARKAARDLGVEIPNDTKGA